MKCIIVIGTLSGNNGGIHTVVLSRTQMLSGIAETTIATLLPDFDKIEKNTVNKLRDENKLANNASVTNMYDFFKIQSQKHSLHNFDINCYFGPKYNFFDSSLVEKMKTDGILTMKEDNGNISYYISDNKVREDVYINGKIEYAYFFDNSGIEILKLYFADKIPYLAEKVEQKRKKHILYPYTDHQQIFNNELWLRAHFIECLCEGEKNNNFVICDGEGCINSCILINPEKAVRIATLHNNHLINPKYRDILIKADKFDALFVLTYGQAIDILKEYNYSNKIFVMPNAIKNIENFDKNKCLSRDKFIISVCQRYASTKRLEHIIRAISKIANQIDRNHFLCRLYGTGIEKEKLTKLVEELCLNDLIKINDFTINVQQIYKESNLFLLTSKYEGFSLAILEALSAKTPVITYKCMYGPLDMVDDGKNGFWVQDGNINQLADTILKFINLNEVTVHNMHENCYEKVQNYFFTNIKKRYKAFFDKYVQSPQTVEIPESSCRASQASSIQSE